MSVCRTHVSGSRVGRAVRSWPGAGRAALPAPASSRHPSGRSTTTDAGGACAGGGSVSISSATAPGARAGAYLPTSAGTSRWTTSSRSSRAARRSPMTTSSSAAAAATTGRAARSAAGTPCARAILHDRPAGPARLERRDEALVAGVLGLRAGPEAAPVAPPDGLAPVRLVPPAGVARAAGRQAVRDATAGEGPARRPTLHAGVDGPAEGQPTGRGAPLDRGPDRNARATRLRRDGDAGVGRRVE